MRRCFGQVQAWTRHVSSHREGLGIFRTESNRVTEPLAGKARAAAYHQSWESLDNKMIMCQSGQHPNNRSSPVGSFEKESHQSNSTVGLAGSFILSTVGHTVVQELQVGFSGCLSCTTSPLRLESRQSDEQPQEQSPALCHLTQLLRLPRIDGFSSQSSFRCQRVHIHHFGYAMDFLMRVSGWCGSALVHCSMMDGFSFTVVELSSRGIHFREGYPVFELST